VLGSQSYTVMTVVPFITYSCIHAISIINIMMPYFVVHVLVFTYTEIVVSG